jgi:hypothetical protein
LNGRPILLGLIAMRGAARPPCAGGDARCSILSKGAPVPESHLSDWQRRLAARLAFALGRELTAADYGCIVWSATPETLRVEAQPLLTELRARNLTSNVFRTYVPR